MRRWLLTNTTYGTWLPGNPRGSVTSVRDFRHGDPASAARIEHDIPGQPWEENLPGLYASSLQLLKAPPIFLDIKHATYLLEQFQETALYRDWTLYAMAIMSTHFHIVVQVPNDPDPSKVLADFKAYGSRALNREFKKPLSATWWTNKGSKRKLPDDRALKNAIDYVLYKQPNPIVVWSLKSGRLI